MSKGKKNILVFGPPSSGKTSMIECLTGSSTYSFDISSNPKDLVFATEVERSGYLWAFVEGGDLISTNGVKLKK